LKKFQKSNEGDLLKEEKVERGLEKITNKGGKVRCD